LNSQTDEYKNHLTFNLEEVEETLNEKLGEVKYIIKTNIEHAIAFGILGVIFLFISTFYSNLLTLQLTAVLSGISALLAYMIFLSKIMKDFALKKEIIKLKNSIHTEEEPSIKLEEIFINKIIEKNMNLFAVTNDEKTIQIVTPYVPEFVLKKEIHVLLFQEKIIDYFYF